MRTAPPALLVSLAVFACSAATTDGGQQGRARWSAATSPGKPAPAGAAPGGPTKSAAANGAEPSSGVASPPLDLPEVRRLPAGMDDGSLVRTLASDPASLGSISVGHPNRGALFNALQMPEGDFWHVVEPKRAWATAETLRSLMTAITAVARSHPGGQKLYVGHLSAEHGGYIRPHRSHQSGRDVDLGYYYSDGALWYARANAKNLDLERTWALVKALSTDPNLENVFMDRSVQKLLHDYAEHQGESAELLDALFQKKPREDKVVRHEWGHLTHMHVRFRSEAAQDAGLRSARVLVASRAIPKRRYY